MWLILTLATLATLRTRRLLTVDDLGHWPRRLIFTGLYRLAGPREGLWNRPKHPRRAWLADKLSEGFDCPWCMPYWIGAAWLGSGLAWGDAWPWQLLAGSLAMSYVVGHAVELLDLDSEE